MSVATADVQATFCATLVDEWVRAGVVHAVVCPGSRSTPLALALAADPGITVHVRLDERSAGFTALGIAMATGMPVVVCVTSGTAAAELHAAVVEAHHGGVPLLVCTADRPPELHGVGAPQTIDQVRLYGPAVRWFAAPGVADPATSATWRSVGARSVVDACAHPTGPGPVHLDLAFREPLVGAAGVLPEGRPLRRPWHDVVGAVQAPEAAVVRGADLVATTTGEHSARRGLLVAGAGAGDPADVVELADVLGWPVLADPRSRCRSLHRCVVATADALLRDGELTARIRPDVVVRLGRPWASKVVNGYLDELAAGGVDTAVVDPHATWNDPGRGAGTILVAEPGAWCRALASRLQAVGLAPCAADHVDGWGSADAAAARALDAWCAGRSELCEPSLAWLLPGIVAADTTLVVGSSMPVRDIEGYAPALAEPLRVLANRGVNGIDGVVSTGLGVALASGPTVVLVGDLSFLHDLTAMVRPAGVDPPCTVVVADNGGGGIFSFLPQAGALPGERFERLFGTPQAVDVVDVARGMGVRVADVGDPAALRSAMDEAARSRGISVVRVRLPGRQVNAALHEELHRQMASAAYEALGLP